MKIVLYFFQFVFILFLFFIFKILGYKKSSKVSSKIVRLVGKKIRTDKIIKKNLAIINKKIDKKIINTNKVVDDVFSNYGRILSDYVFLKDFKNGSLKKYVNIKGNNYLEEIKNQNKKVVFVSGHFNNFELMAMFLDDFGLDLCAIYRPLNNIFLNMVMERLRIKYICKNQIKKGKSGTREMLNHIKENRSVALMIDQRVTEGIRCNFFDEPALTTTIPAQIVKKYDFEIVPVHIERYDEYRFNLNIEKPLKFNENASIEEITNELNKILEKMILKNPSQWILTHNRWK